MPASPCRVTSCVHSPENTPKLSAVPTSLFKPLKKAPARPPSSYHSRTSLSSMGSFTKNYRTTEFRPMACCIPKPKSQSKPAPQVDTHKACRSLLVYKNRIPQHLPKIPIPSTTHRCKSIYNNVKHIKEQKMDSRVQHPGFSRGHPA